MLVQNEFLLFSSLRKRVNMIVIMHWWCIEKKEHFQVLSFTGKVRQFCAPLWCHLKHGVDRLYPSSIQVHQESQ